MSNVFGTTGIGSPINFQAPFNPAPVFSQPSSRPITVNGIESAKAYPMRPDSREFLFDKNEDIFYVKETDSNGFATIRTFAFTEVIEAPKPEEPKYVTVEEFNKFKEELLNGQQFVRSSNTGKTGKQFNSNKKHDGAATEQQ